MRVACSLFTAAVAVAGFAGVARSQTVLSIAAARIDANVDAVPDKKDQTVTVRGVVTSPNYTKPAGASTSTRVSHYIQDGSGGIAFTIPTTTTAIALTDLAPLGTEVEVTGKITQFNGLTQIEVATTDGVKIVSSGNPLPKPLPITLAQFILNPEAFEGMRVRFQNVSKVSGAFPAAGVNGTIQISDSSAVGATAAVFIDADSEVDGTVEPSYPTSFVAIVGQFNSAGVVGGYQLQPYLASEFGIAAQPATPLYFAAIIHGANELPSPNLTTAATGAGAFELSADGKTLTYVLKTNGDHRPFSAAHLHRGSMKVVGPHVVQGNGADPAFPKPTGTSIGQFNFDRQTLRDSLMTGLVYVNLHSALFPAGEARGQVVPLPDATAMPTVISGQLTGAQQTPPADSPAYGTTAAVLTDTYHSAVLAFSGLSGTYAASHFHSGAVGQMGSVVQGFDIVEANQNGSPRMSMGPISTTRRDSLAAGLFYVNVHSSTFPAGEIRANPSATNPGGATGIADRNTGRPNGYALSSASPNPFNPTTALRLTLPEAASVRAAVYNALGQQVRVLRSGETVAAGASSLVFDGAGLPSGLYLVRVTAVSPTGATFRTTRPVMLTK